MKKTDGFDIIIVVSSTLHQADFWRRRLKKSEFSKNAKIFSIHEEWEAGQLLGTLNAWRKVENLIGRKNSSIAIYHTAGKGKRMYPLGCAEIDKGAVKLPGIVRVGKRKEQMTLLEAVIRATSIFAESRKGRICVFWSDGIFIPSRNITYRGGHVELFGIFGKPPTNENEWKSRWQSYGVLLSGKEPKLREKIGWEDYRKIAMGKRIGRNLGCFSLSHDFLFSLLQEYEDDLKGRRKLDTDPDLWMPLTSGEEFRARDKWERVQKFKKRFLSEHDGKLFSLIDLGKRAIWLDFGQARLYHENLLKLLEESRESRALREFFDIEKYMDGSSLLIDSEVKGEINESMLIQAKSRDIYSERGVLVNSQINVCRVNNSLLYNCMELGKISSSAEIICDAFHPGKGRIRMRAGLGRDGKEDWEKRIEPNYYSYQEMEKMMRKLSSKEIENEKKKWEEYYSMNLGEELEEIAGKPIKIEKIRKRKAWGYEEWLCSTHPSIQSRVGVRGRKIPLIHLLNHFPSILDEEWRGELPILLKIIHAEENLSLQLHPSDESAALLQEDDRGKNEAWVVLDAKRKSKIHFLKRYEEEISEEKLFSTSVRKGDVFWIPAGLPHSIGKGITIFEIQQPSALTYRIWDWGRKRKLDLEKASKAVKIFEPEKLRMERRYGKRENLIKNPYFRITEINLERGEGVDLEGFCILTVIQGKAKIGSHILSGGESVILPSNLSCRMEAFQRTVVMESSGVI